LLPAVVALTNEKAPIATLDSPVVFKFNACLPRAVLFLPVVLLDNDN